MSPRATGIIIQLGIFLMKLISLRLFIGLGQGIAIYFLHSSAINAPIWLWELYLIPLILILGVGNLRLKTLLIWSVTATILLYGFSVYNIWQRGLADIFTGKVGLDLVIFAMITLFIIHILVAAGDKDRQFMANYPTYFDMSWKITMQIFLTALFVLFCWGLLLLGSFLFKLIGLDFFGKIIAHSWFIYPATAIVSSVALHITDVQVDLVRGMRTLLLTLLSWLLPILTLIMLSFLISLFFTGLEPVHSKHSTTSNLLIAATILILLINAAYQDGNRERIVPLQLRYAGTFAALILLPVVALCFYRLILRVAQWGWTDSRIMATAWLLVITAYALSYTWAVFAKGPWLKKIEYSNFSIAILLVIIMSALMSPVADPARLSVANQIQRLQSGRIKPDQFDFKYISSHGQRFGQEALLQLKKQHIQDSAEGSPEAAWKKVAMVMVVHTSNGQLSLSFQRQNWQDRQYIGIVPECLNHATGKCDAWVMDLNQDHQDEILILQRERIYGFAQNSAGKWDVIGRWDIPFNCEKTLQAALSGKFQTLPSRWPDLQIQGVRLDFISRPQIICQ